MEEMEEEPATPPTPASPFWLSTRSNHRNLPSSALLNTKLHLAFLSIIAIVLMVLVTPSLLSNTQQIFRPSSVKRGWNSVNLVLVAFAIVCGFLGRKGGEDRSGDQDSHVSRVETSQYVRSGHSNWHSYQGNGVQLRRASSSYPDLIRQEMMWNNHDECNRRPRFYDDSYSVNWCNSPRLLRPIDSFGSQKSDAFDVKVIEVDSVRIDPLSESPPPKPPAAPPSPPSPPPPLEAVSGKEFESVGKRVKRDGQGRKKLAPKEDRSPPPPPPAKPPPPPPETDSDASIGDRRRAIREGSESSEIGVEREGQGRRKLDLREDQSEQPPPPPPPPPPPESSRSGQKKKRSGVTKEIISSIKRKRKVKSKSQENFEDLINPNFPPPPPPPPPPSFLQNMFSSKKTGKSSKKASTSSYSSPPHPPPPPPPPRRRRPPPPSPKRANPDLSDRIVGNGSESPMIRIPPPPPPPPFKVPSWKFVIEGDYVKIVGSPVRDSDSGGSTPTPASPLFCPSPDVNMKADDFIARFRAKLKLEKMNSIKNKQGMEFSLSPLGPDSSPSPV